MHGHSAGAIGFAVPTVYGWIEYSAPSSRLQFAAKASRLHYLSRGKLHYSAPEED